MRLRGYQWAELIGILFLLASTAAQIFYVDPLRREIEWRMATFSMQQTGRLHLNAIYDMRISTLRALKSPDTEITQIETEHRLPARWLRPGDGDGGWETVSVTGSR